MEYAYTYIQKTGGLESYEDYPYVGEVQTCKADKSKYDSDVVISGWEKLGDPDVLIARLDEEEMKEFLYEKGPVGIILNSILLRQYTGGIIEFDDSAPCIVFENGLVVQYGAHDTGEDGYLKIPWRYDMQDKPHVFYVTTTVPGTLAYNYSGISGEIYTTDMEGNPIATHVDWLCLGYPWGFPHFF